MESSAKTIAIDAMGGDLGPSEVVAGVTCTQKQTF